MKHGPFHQMVFLKVFSIAVQWYMVDEFMIMIIFLAQLCFVDVTLDLLYRWFLILSLTTIAQNINKFWRTLIIAGLFRTKTLYLIVGSTFVNRMITNFAYATTIQVSIIYSHHPEFGWRQNELSNEFELSDKSVVKWTPGRDGIQ